MRTLPGPTLPFALVYAFCALALPARAQSSAAPTPRDSTPPATAASAPGALRVIEVTLPSVTASGTPRSFQVVSVPVPDPLAHSA
ncbi:MAG TPA: hypothetical protein VF887_07095, partial [Gemmatimonadaceae bacterium]